MFGSEDCRFGETLILRLESEDVLNQLLLKVAGIMASRIWTCCIEPLKIEGSVCTVPMLQIVVPVLQVDTAQV